MASRLQLNATFTTFLSDNRLIDEASMKSTSIKKLYYSISEVSRITGLEQYVLRYWETEFPELKPAKNRAGNRIYTNKDIKLIMHIKQLLRDEKYTIEGAKQVMKEFTPEPDNGEQLELLNVPQKKKIQDEEIKSELVEVKEFLQEILVKLEK
jgi:DNA-binding transcriptional MerR regulator